jgi:hypothetical protein
MGEIEGHVESESTGKLRVNVNGARLESRRPLQNQRRSSAMMVRNLWAIYLLA